MLSPLLIALVITLAWGVTWFLSGLASKKLGAVHSLFLFQLIGIPFLLPILPFVTTPIPNIQLLYFVLLGISITVGMLAFFYATKVGEISVVTPIADGYLVVLAAFGINFLKEPSSFSKIAAMAVVFVGVLLLGTDFKTVLKKKGAKVFKGVWPALFSTLNSAVNLFLAALLTRNGNWLYTTLGIRIVVTLVPLAILLYRKESFRNLFKGVPWKWLLPAAFGDVVGFALYNFAATFMEVSYLAIFISAQSLVSVALAHIFLKERLKRYQYIGLPLIVGGLILLNISF